MVPARNLAELCRRVDTHAQRLDIRWLAYGHAGDGNLHVNFLWNDPDARPRIDAAIVQLFRDTVDLGGTLTGEHGVGILKAPYLHFEQSAKLIALQQQLKSVFDPEGLLNPGRSSAAAATATASAGTNLCLPKTHPHIKLCGSPHVAMMKASDFRQLDYLPHLPSLYSPGHRGVAFQGQVTS